MSCQALSLYIIQDSRCNSDIIGVVIQDELLFVVSFCIKSPLPPFHKGEQQGTSCPTKSGNCSLSTRNCDSEITGFLKKLHAVPMIVRLGSFEARIDATAFATSLGVMVVRSFHHCSR
jgi:hypothetical protein